MLSSSAGYPYLESLDVRKEKALCSVCLVNSILGSIFPAPKCKVCVCVCVEKLRRIVLRTFLLRDKHVVYTGSGVQVRGGRFGGQNGEGVEWKA